MTKKEMTTDEQIKEFNTIQKEVNKEIEKMDLKRFWIETLRGVKL